MKVHVLLGVNCSCLSVCKGTWRSLRLKIGFEWFRLFLFVMTHIGQLIEKELRHQERSVTWFAKQLCCERTNVYSIFKRETIDTHLLYRISLILKKNFFTIPFEEIEELIRQNYST